MQSKKERFLNLVARESKFLADHGVKEIGLFGSVAREEDNETSDVDVLVHFESKLKNFRNSLTVIDFLEDGMDCPVDLVTRESLSPHLGPHILEEYESFIEECRS